MVSRACIYFVHICYITAHKEKYSVIKKIGTHVLTIVSL